MPGVGRLRRYRRGRDHDIGAGAILVQRFRSLTERNRQPVLTCNATQAIAT